MCVCTPCVCAHPVCVHTQLSCAFSQERKTNFVGPGRLTQLLETGNIWRDLFFTTRQTLFFSEPWQEKQKTTIRHTEPGQYNGCQRPWFFLLPVGRPRPFRLSVRVDRAMGDAPYRRRHEN